MNLVVVDNTFFSDVRVCKQVRFLISKGKTVHVLCLRFNRREPKNSTWNGAKVTAFFIPRTVKNVLYMFFNRLGWYEKLWKILLRSGVDSCPKNIHVHDLYMAKIGFLEKKRWKGKPKLFLDLHENFPAAIQSYSWANRGMRKSLVAPELWEQKEKQYLSYADVVITLSESYAEDLQKKYPELREKAWLAMPNYIDTEWFDRQKKSPVSYETNRRILFYFGAIAKRRGIFDLLNALIEIPETASSFHLVLIGPVDKSDEATFSQIVKSTKLSATVTYIPWIKLSELPSYIANGAICLAPFIPNDQHNSGVANKIFQYMYFEKPILASNCKPQATLITTANNGVVYTDKSSLLQQLKNLSTITDTELVSLGKNGKDYLIHHCSGTKENEALLSLYQ